MFINKNKPSQSILTHPTFITLRFVRVVFSSDELCGASIVICDGAFYSTAKHLRKEKSLLRNFKTISQIGGIDFELTATQPGTPSSDYSRKPERGLI